MSDSQSTNVFMFDNNNLAMQRAYETARTTFRYFWREVHWERRRIIPALELACVKAAFSDEGGTPTRNTPDVEHMWFSEIDFDGRYVSGILVNSPNWLRTIQKGDHVRVAVGNISDWMYAISQKVFGAFTVQVLRSRMDAPERQEHDDAWGLDFGDPNHVRVVPEPGQGEGVLKNWYADSPEHPMSEAMAASFREQVGKDPSLASVTGDRGWTFLHQEALAGNLATATALLDAGADPNAVTADGQTPLQLANALGWERVVVLLAARGAKR